MLADGSTISLDDAKNGAISKQGNTNLINNNGRLTYNPSSLISDQILYNTILTSNGGQYQIELSDGTKVWLNAASSIHFPTSFKGKQRNVAITGEAYFEVAENKKMPFIVTANGAEIQVLGTHFNVMAYLDEPTFKTTLLEGKVKFVNGNTEGILIPGQQLQLTKTGQFKVLNNVNLNGVIAWKNGLFHFENAEIETVIKQVSRWYDVEIICADNNKRVAQNKNTAELMYADIPRSTKLEDVLKALEIASGAKFIIGNKKMIRKNCTTEKLKL